MSQYSGATPDKIPSVAIYVRLIDVGPHPYNVMMAIHLMTDCGLEEAKEWAAEAPGAFWVWESVPEAKRFMDVLKDWGATMSVIGLD